MDGLPRIFRHRRAAGLMVLLSAAAMVGPAQVQPTAQASASAGFRPATYKGIVMGRSKRADVLARFGRPISEGAGEGGGLYMSYNDIGIVKGRAEFFLNPKSLIVYSLDVHPSAGKFQETLDALGADYVVTHWSISRCRAPQPGWGGPLFLDPKGDFHIFEYRSQGIHLSAGSIVYSDRPFGVDRDPCAPRSNRRPAKRSQAPSTGGSSPPPVPRGTP